MTVKIDGTNGVLQAYDYQVLTTGFTYTFAAGTQVLVAVPAATLATGTITMPASPADGMVITIQSSQQITALTLNGNTGQTVVGTAVQIVPNQPLSWVYRLTNTTWYPFSGGAGRASGLVSGTTTATTSGTSIDFTGIPSWVKRITVMLNGVSGSGTSDFLIQIGAGSIDTASYISESMLTRSAGNGPVTSTAGYCMQSYGASFSHYGHMFITTLGSSIWISTHSIIEQSMSATFYGGGVKTLSGTLDRIRLTTRNGTDTFDAGSVNILYE